MSWIVALALGVTLALFGVQNQQPIGISLFGSDYAGIPTWVVVIGSAAVGALMVVIISLVDRLRWFVASRQSVKVLLEHKRMIVQRDNRIHELEQELIRLRGVA